MNDQTTPQISCYILAFNEKDKIADAIRSVQWVDEIVVADSYSTDGTSEMAAQLGARIIQIPFSGYGALRNQAIAACHGEWIFSLDADERCTPEVKDEILAIVSSDNPDEAYYIPRRNYFMGRWIQHSGYYPDYRQPQLFRKGVMIFRPEPVHETFNLLTDKVGYLHHAIWQFPFKDLEQLLYKCNRYSTLGAEKLQTAERREIRMGTALRHGLWAFFHQYFLKRGFLDGWPGFILAISHFEATFYKYAKLYALQSKWSFPKLNDHNVARPSPNQKDE